MNVLITGAASGIGSALKDVYLNNNHQVYCLDLNEINDCDNLTSFKCDITSEESLISIYHYLKNHNITLDLIINVAGIHKMASFVETDYSVMKKVIDVNLCGTMLVNKTFHSRLKDKGKIIIITSEVASFDPMPFNGLYNVSKTALDCYAQSLRQELNLINQHVITFRPGAVVTPLSDNSITDTAMLADNTVLYKKQATKFVNICKRFMGKPLKPEKLARKIYKKSLKKHPKYIYKIHQNIGLVLLDFLPKRLQCFIIKQILK